MWEAACAAFRPLLELERSLEGRRTPSGELGDGVTPEMLARYDRDLERFGREGGYEVQARVSAVLHGLGFDPEAGASPAARHAERRRARAPGPGEPAGRPADLLLLDEPTNHLDLETTAWLVDHLRASTPRR